MSFKKLVTGNACQPSGERFLQNSNPITHFIDSALTKPAITKQLIHGPQMINSPNLLESAFNQPLQAMPSVTSQEFHPQIIPQIMPEIPDAKQLNSLWDIPVEKRAEARFLPPGPIWFRVFLTRF